MRVEKVAFDQTGSFSRIFLDYLAGDPKLARTHAFAPSTAGFEQALSYRKLPASQRNLLVKVLQEQYSGLDVAAAVTKNIALLQEENTFTVTTGHQLNIFTGPLFFIYKIITTINICQELAGMFPEYNFVPVYWMGSEDHDYEEINHIHVDGRKYTWHTGQTGAVGRFAPTGLPELAAEIPGRTDIFKRAYGENSTLAAATRQYVNELFGHTGLVVLEPDNKELKTAFLPVVREELTNQTSYKEILARNEFLVEQGYKPQLNPREINLFYLDDGLRERIELEDGRFVVMNTDISFSREEMLAFAAENPEKISPNVILRPVYQEVILPNLGYVGGPSELAYWLQYKGMFDALKLDFPVLMPRNFGLYLDKNAQRKQQKLGLTYKDLFIRIDELKKKYVHTQNEGLNLDKERQGIISLYKSIKEVAHRIDVTLEPHVEAQIKKHQQCLDKLEAKLVRAEKRNRDTEMAMIKALKDYAFPAGIPQERYVNLLAIPREDFIEQVMAITDPFDLRMHIYLG